MWSEQGIARSLELFADQEAVSRYMVIGENREPAAGRAELSSLMSGYSKGFSASDR